MTETEHPSSSEIQIEAEQTTIQPRHCINPTIEELRSSWQN